MGVPEDLLATARAARERAYAPYSGFPVGAALRGRAGGVYGGANVENAAYPQGCCAEASAIAAMVLDGEREIVEACVVGGGAGLCTPCGGCRQRLREFATDAVVIHVCGPEGWRASFTLGELLPHSFGPDNLGGEAVSAARALAAISRKARGARAEVGLVLGTGLGPLAEGVAEAVSIPYGELPGFPEAGVSGHAGALLLGTLETMPVAILQGRAHYYEHGRADAMAVAIETLKGLGCEVLLLTNSAGSLDPEIVPGWPMLICDHIAWSGMNPLIGTGGDERFVDLVDAYDPRLRERLSQVGAAQGMDLAEGVYMWFSGPSFETPAEIRAARSLGADAVGMSTVPEVILARRHGLRVAAVSMITNFGAGMTDERPSHRQTKDVAAHGAERMQALLRGFLRSLATDPIA